MSYEQACDVLESVDVEMLRDFERELAEAGQQVVSSCRLLSVLDTLEALDGEDGCWLRSMHFNQRLDFVQSCVRVRGAADAAPRQRQPDHSRAPPSTGSTATHLGGLSSALALHQLLARQCGSAAAAAAPAAEGGDALSVLILGAGGCSVPAHLATSLRLPGDGPSRTKIRVPLFAARTLNASGQYRVTLSQR